MDTHKVWRMRDGWAAVLAAAVLYALACSPYELTMAAWIVPGLLLAAVRGLSIRAALVRGCVFALVFGSLQTHWAQLAPFEQAGSVYGPGSLTAVGIAGALPYALLAALYAWTCGTVSARVRPVMAAWLWVGAELLRTEMFSGTQLAQLGHTQVGRGMVTQIAELGGVHAVTFLVVMISVGCAELLIEGSRNRSIAHPARV